MASDLPRIADLLLKNSVGKEDWGEISALNGAGCSKGVANKFLICCLLDFQSPTGEAWRKAERLVERLGDPADLWSTISSFAKEKWDSKYEEFGRPHRFHWGYKRLWGIANDICARHEGDARKIWSGRPPFEVLLHLWGLGAGDQISRMIVGALRDCGQIAGDSGDVKADVHLRRVLGRAVDGEEISATNAARVIQLTRDLSADPWQLDWPLWNLGRSHCRPINPNCGDCYLRDHCAYHQRQGDTAAAGPA